MYPTQLEIELLHADRVRAAEHYQLLQSLRETPTLWERIRARLSTPHVNTTVCEAPATVNQRVRRNAVATTR
ncbi:MAG: hypothetical protein ABI835_06255 [Chloroflexota bacterium]